MTPNDEMRHVATIELPAHVPGFGRLMADCPFAFRLDPVPTRLPHVTAWELRVEDCEDCERHAAVLLLALKLNIVARGLGFRIVKGNELLLRFRGGERYRGAA